MLYEGQYDIIELYSAPKGMNQEIAPSLIPQDYSYYIENIMPTTMGEGRVRFGTKKFSDVPTDSIIETFAFENADGSPQQVIYMNGYHELALNTFTNLVIISPNIIRLTNLSYALFKPDTLLRLQTTTPTGTTAPTTYEILSVTPVDVNTIDIEVNQNTFADNLQNFFATPFWTPDPIYLSPTQFSITVPAGLGSSLYFFDGQLLVLNVDGVPTTLTIAVDGVNATVPGSITFTCTGTDVPDFMFATSVVFTFQSLTPAIASIENSYGYIKVLDVKTNTFLTGVNQTLTNLSVACVPRSEYFAQKLWIYNGVDPVMTWDGSVLKVYTELVKENAPNLNRVDDTHFTFKPSNDGAPFDITKYENNNTIYVDVIKGGNLTTTATNATYVDNLVTITTQDVLPEWSGSNRVELFYTDKPPPFSFMKSAHDRLWCLGPGAVGLDYRIPDQALRFYYSFTTYGGIATDFRFIDENTKFVPSEEISAKHGSPDNLEAIVLVHGYLAFVGRQKTQIWRGINPSIDNQTNSFSWVATLPVGIFHGNLIVELANDTFFLSQNGFLSVSTFNIARQFGATPTNNMDKLALEYIKSITTNRQYRACKAFKYDNGTFCGFKIGPNKVIVSRYHTSLYWWAVFSGDFAKSATFLSNIKSPLYLYIGNTIYTYGDGMDGISYGDNDGKDLISFNETKYVNNLKKRYSNKRYEIQADYSSNVLINKGNVVNIYIRGDLRTSFTLSDVYNLRNRGDVLGTINLADGEGSDPNNPNNPKILNGFRLDSPHQTLKGRLKFVSSVFSVSLIGKTKDGPFSLKKIRLFGFAER